MAGLSFPRSSGKVSARCALRTASIGGVVSGLDGKESRACWWSATASWRGDMGPGDSLRGTSKYDRDSGSGLLSLSCFGPITFSVDDLCGVYVVRGDTGSSMLDLEGSLDCEGLAKEERLP